LNARGRCWRTRSRGGSTTLFSLLLPVMMAMTGLMLDGGMLMMYRMKLAAVTDAAALQAAGLFEPVLHDQGELSSETICITPDCLETETTYTCWRLWVHQPLDDAGAQGEAFAATQMNLVTTGVTVTAWQEEESDRPPPLPDEANGRARWEVKAEGSVRAPLFIMRMFGQERFTVHATSTLVWEEPDVFDTFTSRNGCASD
jgi:hypothetical protein